MNTAKKRLYIPFFLILLLIALGPVKTVLGADINITDVDDAVGESLGLTGTDASVVGGLILTIVLVLMCLLPTGVVVAKAKDGAEYALIMAVILPILLSTGLGWLDPFVTLLIVLITVGLLASTVAGVFNK